MSPITSGLTLFGSWQFLTVTGDLNIGSKGRTGLGEGGCRKIRGQPGETIRIRASDDFQVAGVGVRILDAAGTTLEQGATVPGMEGVIQGKI